MMTPVSSIDHSNSTSESYVDLDSPSSTISAKNTSQFLASETHEKTTSQKMSVDFFEEAEFWERVVKGVVPDEKMAKIKKKIEELKAENSDAMEKIRKLSEYMKSYFRNLSRASSPRIHEITSQPTIEAKLNKAQEEAYNEIEFWKKVIEDEVFKYERNKDERDKIRETIKDLENKSLNTVEYAKNLSKYMRKNFSQVIKRVRYLNVYNLTSAQIKSFIGLFEGLRDLRLVDCSIQQLPPEIGNLKKLEILEIRGGQLKALPPEIGDLEKLETLKIRGSQLKALPPEIGNLENLKFLEVSNSFLDTLPSSIGELKKLRTLILSGNSLDCLWPKIWKLTSLKTLDLSGNKISYLEFLEELNLLENLRVNPELYLFFDDKLKMLQCLYKYEEQIMAFFVGIYAQRAKNPKASYKNSNKDLLSLFFKKLSGERARTM